MAVTLSQVLASGGQSSSFNLAQFAAVLAAVSITAFSIVKGYEISRRRSFTSVVEDTPIPSEIEEKERIEKLSFMIDELKHEKDFLTEQNRELRDRLRGLESLKQMEEVLRRSNAALARECEKLRAEKEELLLKTVQPLVEVKPQTKTAKKGMARRPKRVSRKGK